MANSFLPHYGPIWKRKDHFGKAPLPVPNCINCGPVLNTCTFTPHSQESTNIDLVKVRQDPCAKFPLECITPPLQPLYPNLIASHSFVPWHARNYYPNILSSFTLNGSDHLIYGENSDSGNIVKLAMIKNSNSKVKLKNKRNLSRYKTFQQADSAMVNGFPIALLRLDDSINLFRIDAESFDVYSLCESKTVHCCLNKILNDNFSFSNKDGFVSIYDIVGNQCRWRGQFNISRDNFLISEFGCHPLQMHVASSSEVWLIDSRGDHHVSNNQKIFDKNNISANYGGDKSICNIKCMPETPYIYVICTECVFLMDTRHSKQPLVMSFHMMTSNPSYPHSLKINGTNALFLTHPIKNQICIIPTCWKGTDSSSYIQNSSTPRHFNLAKDTFNYARRNGIFFSTHIERNLESPLIGLTVIPSIDEREVCIYLQNHFGNLFYSKFVSPGEMVQNSESDTISTLKKFEENLSRQKIPISHSKRSVTCLENLNLRPTYIPKTGYMIFKHASSGKSYSVELNSIQKPESTGLISDNELQQKLSKLNFPVDSLPKESINNLDFSVLKTFSDQLSTNILSIWNKDLEENFEKSLLKDDEWFPFQRFPINLDETLREKLLLFKPNKSKEASFLSSEKEEEYIPVLPDPEIKKQASKRRSHVSGF